jgi:hypothetical protein
MPSKSEKQARFMAAVANNPKFAKKAGVSQAVGREFADADRRIDMPSKYNSTANKPGKAVKKYRGGGRTVVGRQGMHEGGDVDRRRDLRDEEGRVISEQDDHRDELERIKGDRGRNRGEERGRVRGALRDEEEEMRRLRGKAVGMGMKKGGKVGKVRGAGIATQGVRPCKMV